MIDAVDVVLAEDLLNGCLQRARRREIGPERLLDDDARPALLVVARVEIRAAQQFDDSRKDRGRRREIEEAVPAGPEALVVLFEPLAQFLEV